MASKKRLNYEVLETKRVGAQTQTLIRFRLPELGRSRRKKLLETVLEESGADALMELFWTKGSILYKDNRNFDAILVFDAPHVRA